MKFLDDWHNRRLFAKYNIQWDAFPTINGRVRIGDFGQNGSIRFGRDVVINSSVEANPVGGQQTIFLFKGPDAPKIIIEDGVGMSNVTICAATTVRIGKHAQLGAGCQIFDTDFHSIHYELRMDGDRGMKSAPVTLEEGCFVGGGALILKGVTVGREAVIAARAVVTKNVGPREIWGGNPAKCIGKVPELAE